MVRDALDLALARPVPEALEKAYDLVLEVAPGRARKALPIREPSGVWLRPPVGVLQGGPPVITRPRITAPRPGPRSAAARPDVAPGRPGITGPLRRAELPGARPPGLAPQVPALPALAKAKVMPPVDAGNPLDIVRRIRPMHDALPAGGEVKDPALVALTVAEIAPPQKVKRPDVRLQRQVKVTRRETVEARPLQDLRLQTGSPQHPGLAAPAAAAETRPPNAVTYRAQVEKGSP